MSEGLQQFEVRCRAGWCKWASVAFKENRFEYIILFAVKKWPKVYFFYFSESKNTNTNSRKSESKMQRIEAGVDFFLAQTIDLHSISLSVV